MQSIKCSLQIY